ncbi:hypothetical protein IDSA_01685 [Pseudidiomarina salinarum]|uniref:Uncharacterized protein n=1 Tax=Pseudidiomarina salinarum TaxID=435908 RepID=A0A094L9F6_9GAMM|nr:hypothetical protein [Pseudidiomarina salinarum]KFZ31453.1 hypothetical protein IDSA_01685 [Pseudidiomarina salinarum]RUO70785.1 hypothetical protein CWI79_04880 [Pseudidiomarina salinarum]
MNYLAQITGSGALLLASAFSAAAVSAPDEQTLSERVGEMIQQQVEQRLAADLSFGAFELNTLTAELAAADVLLASRVTELDAGLNQVLRAREVVIQGDWLTPTRNQLVLDGIVASDAQLTIAYYGKGKSNLHALYDAYMAQQPVYKASERLIWELGEVQLNNVVVNLFDSGLPILSVQLDTLTLPPMASTDNADDYIARVLVPLLNQVQRQIRNGDLDAAVDASRLMGFMWREAFVGF